MKCINRKELNQMFHSICLEESIFEAEKHAKKIEKGKEDVQDAAQQIVTDLRNMLIETSAISEEDVASIAKEAEGKSTEDIKNLAELFREDKAIQGILREKSLKIEEICKQWRSTQKDRIQMEAQILLRDIQSEAKDALQSYKSELGSKCNNRKYVTGLKELHETAQSSAIKCFKNATSNKNSIKSNVLKDEMEKQLDLLEKKIKETYENLEKDNLQKKDFEEKKEIKRTLEKKMDEVLKKFDKIAQDMLSNSKKISKFRLKLREQQEILLTQFDDDVKNFDKHTVDEFRTRLNNELKDKFERSLTLKKKNKNTSAEKFKKIATNFVNGNRSFNTEQQHDPDPRTSGGGSGQGNSPI